VILPLVSVQGGETVVREVETLAIGQDVLEVRVEVKEPAAVHEGDAGCQFPLHHGAGSVGGLVSCLDLGAQPLVQVLRDVLNEQRDARRGLLESMDPAAHLRSAAPVGDGPFDVGQFFGEGVESGSTRQWYMRGKPSCSAASTQFVVIVCTASSLQAPNPGAPTALWAIRRAPRDMSGRFTAAFTWVPTSILRWLRSPAERNDV
jgi:hypothetical protein